jgi:hypothetical protein
MSVGPLDVSFITYEYSAFPALSFIAIVISNECAY